MIVPASRRRSASFLRSGAAQARVANKERSKLALPNCKAKCINVISPETSPAR